MWEGRGANSSAGVGHSRDEDSLHNVLHNQIQFLCFCHRLHMLTLPGSCLAYKLGVETVDWAHVCD